MPEHDLFDFVYIFAVSGLLGTIYEVLLTLILHGALEDRSGSVLTAFNYVYGVGAVAIFLVMYRIKKPLTVFVLGTVLGGVVEYGLSVFQELFLGSRSWDYSAKFLNIGGRTTIPYMLVWGLLCYLCVRFVFPILLTLLHRIPPRLRKGISAALLGLIVVDAVVTSLAVLRYSQRAEEIYFANAFFNTIDRLFNDAFMQVHFPNMALGC